MERMFRRKLSRRLLEEKAQAAFARAARRVEKVGGQTRLSRYPRLPETRIVLPR
jgi:hypothetical protein